MKAYAASFGEQVNLRHTTGCIYIQYFLRRHSPRCRLQHGPSTLTEPRSTIQIPTPTSAIRPAYAIETCTYVLAPLQRISQEGVVKNTPPGNTVATPERYNGHTRIYGLDGSLLAKPNKKFEGLVFVNVSTIVIFSQCARVLESRTKTQIPNPTLLPLRIDLNEAHLPKSLADFGGYYMRPDLIRLIVDTRRKSIFVGAAYGAETGCTADEEDCASFGAFGGGS